MIGAFLLWVVVLAVLLLRRSREPDGTLDQDTPPRNLPTA